MKLNHIVEKIKNIATEANSSDNVETNIILIRNEDGTYTEVKSYGNND